jgi:NADH-quinone oxidoreductase subunit L
MGGEQDIRKMGGLKKYMPVTYWTFLTGLLAISGIPIFSGFFSKDEILWQTFSSPLGGLPYYVITLITAGLTATYMGRMFCLTFLGENRSSHEVQHHLHESPLLMTAPLVVLALLSTVGGFLAVPHFMGGEVIHNFLEHSLEAIVPASLGHGTVAMEWALVVVSVLVGSSCLYGAYYLYILKAPKEQSMAEPRGFSAFLFNSYYLNEFYEATVIKPIHASSIFLWKVVDVVIVDGAVLLFGKASVFFGKTIRGAQTGSLEHYLIAMLLGTVVLLGVLLTKVL